MPANVSAKYKNAEHASRPARESFERLDWPREMLRAIDAGFSQLVSLLRAWAQRFAFEGCQTAYCTC
jgi:hypothetical protein